MGGTAGYVRSSVLRHVRDRGVASRLGLAKALSVSPPTIGNAVKRLLAEEVLVVDGFQESDGGRRARLFRINPNLAHVVGLEVSLAGIRSAVVDVSGSVLSECVVAGRPSGDRDEMLAVIEGAIEHVLARSDGERVRGIGVGISGIVSPDGATSVRFPFSETWMDVPLARVLQERFHQPVRVANLVHAVTLGELRCGAGGEAGDFLCLYVGLGIGLGAVVNRRLLRGAAGASGELGHVTVDPDGPVCYCGNYGCLESVASMLSMATEAGEALRQGVESSIRSGPGGTVEPDAVLDAADGGDRLAVNIVERAGRQLGLTLAGVANIFDPAHIVLAGPGFLGSRLLVEVVGRVFRSRVLPARRDRTAIMSARLGTRGPSIGAANLIVDELLESV